jgi:hypothetical protein
MDRLEQMRLANLQIQRYNLTVKPQARMRLITAADTHMSDQDIAVCEETFKRRANERNAIALEPPKPVPLSREEKARLKAEHDAYVARGLAERERVTRETERIVAERKRQEMADYWDGKKRR